MRLRQLAVVFVLLASAVSCDCGDDTLGGVEAGFRVTSASVDFGRALEGGSVVKEVELLSVSRGDVQVAAAVEGPFSVPATVVVPAGSTVLLQVAFLAGSTREEGRLLLGPEDQQVVVSLVGEGVRPLECRPSAVCRQSVFVLETNSCIESAANEGAGCISPNVCIENGSCRSGACVGTPRTCDDQDRCTVDGCSATTGCVNVPLQCPLPTVACRVATCDPQTGCGQANAQDGTRCGGADCVKVSTCVSGGCAQVDTPEGFLCAPPTPCQAEGRCRSKQCVRPDAGELPAEFAASVSGKLVRDGGEPTLLAHNGNLFFDVCGLNDGGCELLSYTPTGFLRFNRGHGDANRRWVQLVTDAGVVVSDGEALELFALGNGAPLARWSSGGSIASDAVVALRDGGLAVLTVGSDGGATLQLLALRADGGEPLAFDTTGAVLAAAANDSLVSWSVGGALQVLGEGSGTTALYADAGLRSAAVSGGVVLAGGGAVFLSDAGAVSFDWSSFANPRAPLARSVFAGDGLGFVFANSCEPPSVPVCSADELQTELFAFSLVDAQSRWQVKVLPSQASASLEEAAVVDFPGGAVVTLSDVSLDGGMQTYLQLFVGGERAYFCPLPSGGRIQGAVFDRGRLFVLMDRSGVSRLESYDLKGLPLSTSGWPQRNGVAGTRREH